MPKANMRFNALQCETTEVGTGSEHFMATIFGQAFANGKSYPKVTIQVKQVVGSKTDEHLFEVSKPVGYDGPYNFEILRKAVETYVMMCGVHFGVANGSKLIANNNLFVQTAIYDVE